MAQTNSGNIQAIFKSRQNLLKTLNLRGYDVSAYSGASMTEVSSMFGTKQLDMLISYNNELLEDDDNDTEKGKKVFIKYHLAKGLRQNNIHEYIEELFQLDQILTKNDDFIIIVKDEPNDSLIKNLRNIWEQEGYFITVLCLARLQFNILDHELVPPHRKLSPNKAEEIKLQYNITKDSEIPDISRFSPVAQIIGLRPGDICEIKRPSKTGITTLFYRICSA